MSEIISEEIINPKMTVYEKVKVIVDSYAKKEDGLVSDQEKLYRWNGRTYDEVNECELSQEIEKEYHQHEWIDWSTKRFDEIYKSLVRRCYKKEIVDKEIPGDWILFKNVIYDIKNKVELPYSKEHFITKTLAYDYYPLDNDDSRPNNFIKTLMATVPNDKDREKLVSFLQYSLTTSMDHQISLIIIGERGTGKSAFMDFIVDLFGDKATSFELSSFNGDEGYRVKVCFKNRTLAYSDEIGGTFLYVSGMNRLKNMVSNVHQSGRAAFEKRQEWKNTTKFIFTTNTLPALEAPDDEGFFRRFEIIIFDQCFVSDVHDDDSEDPRDLRPYDEILKTEAGQVLSMLARHVCKYDFKPKIADIKHKWLLNSDGVYAFIDDYKMVEITNSDGSYADYVNFCASKHYVKVLGQRQFLNRMTAFGVRRPRNFTEVETNEEPVEEQEDIE
jgi:phage/plasmid-associated DNA primase